MLTMKDLRVGDVMTPTPDLLGERDTLVDAIRFFQEKGVSGAPVVGSDGVLLSVLSTSDLLRELSVVVTTELHPDQDGLRALARRGIGTLVKRSALSCQASESLAVACRRMIQNHVHRLVVLQDGKPVGILTAIDAARTIACLDDLEVRLTPEEVSSPIPGR